MLTDHFSFYNSPGAVLRFNGYYGLTDTDLSVERDTGVPNIYTVRLVISSNSY